MIDYLKLGVYPLIRMYNFHPFLTAFPLVCFTLVVFAEAYLLKKDVQFLSKSSNIILILGCIFTVLAFLTGNMAAENASQSFIVPTDSIANHYSTGKLILFLLIPLLVFVFLKKENHFIKYLYYVNLLLVYVLVLYAGYLGSQLVFEHGAGVKVNNVIISQ